MKNKESSLGNDRAVVGNDLVPRLAELIGEEESSGKNSRRKKKAFAPPSERTARCRCCWEDEPHVGMKKAVAAEEECPSAERSRLTVVGKES